MAIKRFFSTASLCALAAAGSVVGADLATGPKARLSSGGELRAAVHPATGKESETVILEAPGLLIELPRDGVDEIVSPDPLLVEYAGEAEKATPDAAGQWAMAEWCEARDLEPEREFHLRRTVAADPNHAEARKALGYNLIDGKWIHPEQSMIDAGFVRRQGRWYSELELKRILAEEQAEATRRGYLRSMLLWRNQIGKMQGKRDVELMLNFQRVQDPLAVFAFRELLKDEQLEVMRRLYIDVLGRIPGPEADSTLAELAVSDSLDSLRSRAVDRLATRQAFSVVPSLIAQLYTKDDNVRVNRAAAALGGLQDPRAIPALIDVLVTERKVEVGGGSAGSISPGFSSGSNGSSGAGMSAGSSRRVETQQVPNADVFAALVDMTGQNYGYDEQSWRRWYSEFRSLKNPNLRELPR